MDAPIALTGASGFVGGRILQRLQDAGRTIRVLARRPERLALTDGVEVVPGCVEDREALDRLVRGASTIIHCAGVVKARSIDEFHAVNAQATAELGKAVVAAGDGARLLLVSSLAARQPDLSGYAASKLAAERALEDLAGLSWLALRPPAIYGPGDRATMPLVQGLARGLLPVPAPRDARFSLLYVDDLADAVMHLLEVSGWSGQLLEFDDGQPGGYAWADLAEIAGARLGKPVRLVHLPQALLWPAAQAAGLWSQISGRAGIFGPGKLRELKYPDWVVNSRDSDRLLDGWRAHVRFGDGFERALAWYKKEGWI